jgi:AraC-like DNA-binding protein
VVGLDAELAVTTGPRSRPRRAGAVLTAPDAPHAVDARGTRALVVFVAPESDAGARLRAAHGADAVELVRGGAADRVRALLAPGPALADPERAVREALSLGDASIPAPPGSHPGVKRVLRFLRDAPPGADVSLATLAAIAGLSPGRFMHAFTAAVGIPLRPYLRWLRLERAGAALAAGAPLGEAAYAAGFADAAHMSRTFKRMFGVSPSDVKRRSQSVQEA